MHRVLRGETFPAEGPAVATQRLVVHEEVPVHGHAFLELAVVEAGAATHFAAAGSQPLSRGSLVVVRPGEWHRYAGVDRLCVRNVYVGPEVLRHDLAWITEDPRLTALLRPPGRSALGVAPTAGRLDREALEVVTRCCEALSAPPPRVSARVTRLGHLILLLGQLAAGLELGVEQDLPVSTHPAVGSCLRMLEADLAGTWSLARLSEALYLSPAHLTRLFTRQVGLPPIAYLNRLRAERASALLIETDLPVAAVGAEVGWADPSYASRRFRAVFALSPARYRASFRPADLRRVSPASS